MFAKLVLVILSVGITAGVLLATRQQRVQTAHELADVQRRVAEHDRTLWRLRAEIASRITPTRISAAAARLGPLAPINQDRLRELVLREVAEEAALPQLAAAPFIEPPP